ncbi:CDK5RAP1-like protein [Topomyia yanbarensis]|uniref:CDK5RAP1-like protein n=1 Tax=Topomyia yanbarensis TaxID=2498891 RepID=UPI00273BA0E8|nr:CDK5RAP1-like protein [Topomyia yanbarensis]
MNRLIRRLSPVILREASSNSKRSLRDGPSFQHFLRQSDSPSTSSTEIHQVKRSSDIPYLAKEDLLGQRKKVFFEIYGCQMNTNDMEIVWSILKAHDYQRVGSLRDADIVLMITCAIRDGAESTIWNRLKHIRQLKEKQEEIRTLQIGVLGCMAERLKNQLVEKERAVDVVAGPDSYKDLPRLLAVGQRGQKAINVMLSMDETYADVIPVKLDRKSRTAFVSIMRGCDNMCSFCIVPFTRGKERSRPISSIKEEVLHLAAKGIKEVTLLGQNVNSYRDTSSSFASGEKEASILAPGFKTVYKTKVGGLRFAELLADLAETVPDMRIRFTSPHPKDFPKDVLKTIAQYPNICNSLHLPAQAGNSAVLERMRRGYTREAYLNLVKEVRAVIPNVTLSSDFICGFCGETDEEFADTISLINEVKYHNAFLFAYSMREKTAAHRRFLDDVPEYVKKHRLQEMIKSFRYHAAQLNALYVGREELIMVEGRSKRSPNDLSGRNDGNIKVIIPAGDVPFGDPHSADRKTIVSGDCVVVRISESNSQILKGVPIYHTTISQYAERSIVCESSSINLSN